MTVAGLSIPRGWEAINAEWMTAALADHFPGATVSDVAVVLRDDGTNRRARLALTYSAGDGPPTVFAKAVDPEHADLVALTSGLYHEPRLFGAGVVLPLDHPAVYTAIIDEDRRDFLMIMEDVNPDGGYISAAQSVITSQILERVRSQSAIIRLLVLQVVLVLMAVSRRSATTSRSSSNRSA